MPLIKHHQLIEDHWTMVDAETATVDTLPPGNIIVPVALWLTHKTALQARPGDIGICLTGDDNIEDIAKDLPGFGVIALSFPIFRDGRAFSMAHKLRQQYRYEGELRAVGQVMVDQLSFMERVGFDAFLPQSSQSTDDALAAFDMISVKYQASHDEPRPLFLRR